MLSVLLQTTSDRRRVRGGVLRGTPLRLLGIDDINIEVPLEGHLIYIHNLDVPGVIGKIGTILGHGQVNIANFALGRSESGGKAIAVVQVDTPAPEPVLQKLRELPEIHEVRGISLGN